MVAIVSGSSLGLSLGSLRTLGQQGVFGSAAQGRSGEQAYVNVATGNLVLQHRDELLSGRGLDIGSFRTYNSQGRFTDANDDGWLVGAFGERVTANGPLGQTGSVVTRTDRDGAQTTYLWDATRSAYVSSAGAGAYDTITYDSQASQFLWTDGDTGSSERYQASAAGRLISATDADGNNVSLAYDTAGHVQSMTDANGEVTCYDYVGDNLVQIRTITSANVTSTRVHYGYDNSNRLVMVTVDLSPEDNSVADGNTYVTRYTYDGASTRIATITQADGTSQRLTYTQAGGEYKVSSVTDALGAVTTFAYDPVAGTTTVTDALGSSSKFLYDSQGQLLQVRQGVTATNPAGLSQISYLYDAQGNVALVTDGEGRKVRFEYDGNGNLLKEVDGAGDTRVRTYNAANQLLTDTRFANAAVDDRGAFNTAAALPETTRYVYAPGNLRQLSFMISAQGEVTEYRYDSYGQRTSVITYAGALYNLSALGQDQVPTQAQMVSWRQTQDLTRSQRTDYAFDGRGALASTTAYGQTASTGEGVATTAATTHYVYDQQGLLLQKIEPGNEAGATSYVYDGLGRLLVATGPAADGQGQGITVTAYDDAHGATSVTAADGLTTISSYDKAGRLVAVAQSRAGMGVLGTTTYSYDAEGRLLMTQDPTGVRAWTLYDAAGRKAADIDALGAMTEYVYNANDQLTRTIAYATAVDTSALVDSAGRPTTAWHADNAVTSVAALRPQPTDKDQQVWRFYDGANRLVWQVDALGYVTRTVYDGASRVLSVTQLARPIDVRSLSGTTPVELLVDPGSVGGVSLTLPPTSGAYFGAPLPLKATIDGADPGGMVTFFANDTIVGSALVINGVATLFTDELPVGTLSIRAVYSGSASRPAATSAASTLVVQRTPPSVTLSMSPVATFWSLPVTLVATVAAAQGFVHIATGQVQFFNGSTLIGTATLDKGQAVLTLNSLPMGRNSIRAEYAGDDSYTSASVSEYQTVQVAPTRTSLQIEPVVGGTVLRASVGPTLGTVPAPAGRVTFYSGSTALGSAQIVEGVAALTCSGALPAGALTAVYEGDAVNAGSSSALTSQIALTASASTIKQGQPLTLSATVAGAEPGGVVTFFSGTQYLGRADVINGQASLVTSYLPIGSAVLTAAYGGGASKSSSVAQTSGPITVSAGTGVVAPPPQTERSFEVVTASSGSVGLRTRSAIDAPIAVFDGQTLIGCFKVTAVDSGGRYFSLPGLPKGAHELTIVCAGDSTVPWSGTMASTTRVQTTVGGLSPASMGSLRSANPMPMVGSRNQLTLQFTTQNSATGSVPTGTVHFYRDGAPIGDVQLVNGAASLDVDLTQIGRQMFTATYDGDATFEAMSWTRAVDVRASSQSLSVSVTVGIAPPVANYGSPVTLRASVGAGSLATGTVRFYRAAELLGEAPLTEGQAVLQLSRLEPGTATINAVYSGDENYSPTDAASGLRTGSVTVLKAPTAMALAASTSSLTQGQSVTLTATVAGAAPGGLVSFFSGMQYLGSASVLNGVASLSTNALPGGTNVLTASYGGDAHNVGSASAAGTSVVVQAAGSASGIPALAAMDATVYTVSQTDGAAGVYVRLDGRASVNGAYPGTFTVFDGSTLLGSFVATASQDSVPSSMPGFIVPNLNKGDHRLTIIYSGSGTSPAASVQKSVTAIPVQVAVGLATSQSGSSATFTASVSPKLPTYQGPTISGVVTFYNNGVAIGTASVSNGVATLTVANFPARGSITASYAGDSTYATGSASPVNHGSTTPTNVALQVSAGITGYGSSVSLTATVTSLYQTSLSGLVRFYEGTVLIGTSTVQGGKTALNLGELSAGTHWIRAVYAGDLNNAAAESTQTVVVKPRKTSLAVIGEQSMAADGSLSVQVNGGLNTGGMVNFYAGSRLLGTAAVVNGVATLTGAHLPGGTYAITAAYSGDGNNADVETTFTRTVAGAESTPVYVALDVIQDRSSTRLYDRDGQLMATLDAEGGVTEYKYDAAGRVVQSIQYSRLSTWQSMTAADRQAVLATARASYSLGSLRPVLDGVAIYDNYFYDAQGRLVGHVDGEDRLTETVYDARGNVVKTIRYARGVNRNATTLEGVRPTLTSGYDKVETQTWSAANLLVSSTNAEGTITRYTYDRAGHLVQRTVALGTTDERSAKYLYDAQGRLIGELDGRGSEAVAASDAFGQWQANGTTHTYDAADRRTSTTDAEGHRTLFFYDAAGRLRYTVNAEGEVRESHYNALDQLTEQVAYGTRLDASAMASLAPGGLDSTALAAQLVLIADAAKDSRTSHDYTAVGTESRTTDALGHVTQYSYNAFREALATNYTLASGQVVTDTASYDRRGLRTIFVRDAGGLAITERTYYDAFGRATTRLDGAGRSSFVTYDRLGRIVTTGHGLGNVTRTTYDVFDRVQMRTDALNNNTIYWYDPTTRTVTTTTPEGVVIKTVYNREGQVQSVTDGRGNTTSYSYDKSGNLVKTEGPLGVTSSAAYDKADRLVQTTDARGVQTVYTYDAANRQLSRTVDPSGLNQLTTYAYDAKGQAICVTDPRGVVTLTEFDLNGQTLSQTVDPGGLNLRTSYVHDTTGRVLTVTDANGNLTRYEYDAAGRRVSETVDPGGLNLTRRYEYDGADNVVRSIDGNGNATRYIYDSYNREMYRIDALGNVQFTEYDAENRVVRRTAFATPISLAGITNSTVWTVISGRLTASASDVVEQRRYDRQGRLQFTIDGTGAVLEYKYDANDNIVETRAYANRINPSALGLGAKPAVVVDASRDQRVRVVYDAQNRATWKVDGAGNVTSYAYDANGNVTDRRAFANALTSTAFTSWNGSSAPTVTADDSRDQRLRTVYDNANRAVWSVDALGDVTQMRYDANGNLIERRAYAKALTGTALAAWNGRIAPAAVTDDAHDARTRQVFDAANRLSWTVDGTGAVSHLEYDANGNITRSRQYLTPIDYSADPTSAVQSDGDRTVDYLYDKGNRLSYQLRWASGSYLLPGAGSVREVTSYAYDGAGHVVRQTAHAWPLPASVGNDTASVANNLVVAPDQDQSQFMAYDAAGRLRYSVDGEGAVTRNSYDGTGRIIRTEQFAKAIDTQLSQPAQRSTGTAALSLADIESRLQTSAGRDRITAMAHDAAGRTTFTVDALGGVSQTVYDAFGNVTLQASYATRITPPTSASVYSDATLASSIVTNASADRIQRMAWDQANRQVFAVDALGGTVETSYDGVGLAVQSRQYARAVATTGLALTASVADIRSRLSTDAANDRIIQQAYDAAGRRIYSVDALGFVTRNSYDALGQLNASTQYALAVPATTANTAAAWAAAVVAIGADRSTTYSHDAAGRLLATTDALGYTESWSYDALGNKRTHTNAKGAVWTYDYDRTGRLRMEVSPQVELTAVKSVNGSLRIDAANSGQGSVITQMVYDAFGNLRWRTEAVGRPEQRTTEYQYDQVGRQVRVIYPPVGVYELTGQAVATNGGASMGDRVDVTQALSTETTYDALGNAIANRDVGGAYSYKTYDALGRVAFEVDALGYVSGYGRNTFGDATALTRYGTASGLTAGNPPSLNTAQVQAAVAGLDHSADRVLLTAYDRLGRVIEVKEPTVLVYDSSAGASGTYAYLAKTTRSTYNSFGNLVQVASLKSADNWVLDTRFFDKRGQQIGSVDALGYLTVDHFDSAGNAVEHLEYATAARNADGSAWVGTSAMVGWTGLAATAGTQPVAGASPNDRRTTFTFDADNRKISETRVNVEYSSSANGSTQRGNLTSTYAYDAVGNLTRSTDALGASTYTYYDALGRSVAVAGPARSSTEGGGSITPLTVYRHDAYGNVVAKTDYVNGAVLNGDGYGAAAPNPLPDKVQIPSTELASVRASGWRDEGSMGYISTAAFDGGTALYRLRNTFNNQHLYTISATERSSLLASGLYTDEGVSGYVLPPGSGGQPVYRLSRFVPLLGLTHFLTTDPAEAESQVASGAMLDGEAFETRTNADASMDTRLLRLAGPVFSDHIYLAESTSVAPDPSRDADLFAKTDRTSYAQYDSRGNQVQSTDATGVNHYSAYNAQGLLARQWQQVSDNDGASHTLWKAYQYDALGRQTHIYEPGTPTDGVNTAGTTGIAGYAANPGAAVTAGSYQTANNGSGQPVGNESNSPSQEPAIASAGKLTLSRLDNLITTLDGGFQVEFDYITPDYTVTTPGDESSTGSGTTQHDSHTYISSYLLAAQASGAVELVPDHPIGTITGIRIYRVASLSGLSLAGVPLPNRQLLWQGSAAQANGGVSIGAGAEQPGTLVDTAVSYNAFGEVTHRNVAGLRDEYFDYDTAGRLWRTNAGDGVDKVALYDTQGHQTAQIGSAGQGRGDIDLRAAGDAQQVASLRDVRRTDTIYDLLGRVVEQRLPERQEVQGGASVRAEALTGGIVARATATQGDTTSVAVIGQGPQTIWSGSNVVNLGWNSTADLGSGDVLVRIRYIPRDANGNEGPEQSVTRILNAAQAGGGASIGWSQNDAGGTDAISRISRIEVFKKDTQADWVALINQSGFGDTAQTLLLDSPADSGATVLLEIRPAGSQSAWTTLATTNFGDRLRADISALALGNYEYRASTTVPGRAAVQTATGSFSITPKVLASFAVAGINGGSQTLEWAGPGNGDIQTVRVRQSGGSWIEIGSSQPNGDNWTVASLAGLQAGSYDYEVLWTHAGQPGPYAHATGHFDKTAGIPGTPGTPGTPASGLPHIDGLSVGTQQIQTVQDESGNPITTTHWVVRLPPPPGQVPAFFLGAGGFQYPVTLGVDGGVFIADITAQNLSPGTYTFGYGWFPYVGANATAHAVGTITVNADGSIVLNDTTPPYTPATPGTPGTPDTPPQYGWSASDAGPYALSQDPTSAGRSVGQSTGLNGVADWVRPVVQQNVDRWGNVLSISDPRSTAWKTTYRYNANNQVIEQVQPDSNGFASTASPVTRIAYDALGRQVAVTDANGHTNGQEWDAAGQLVREVHADGGVVQHAYDAFGDEVRRIDALGAPTWYTHDKLGRLIKTTHALADVYSWQGSNGLSPAYAGQANLTETQRWDQAGRLLSSTNGAGETTRYAYDLRGNLIRTTKPEGQSTLAGYDALNRKVLQADGNGAVSAWGYDGWGRLSGYIDIGRASHGYAYDHAGQLVAQSSSRGQNRVYSYDAAGQLVQINDIALGQTTRYQYDLGGRHLRETTVQGGITYQDNRIAYDALGRMRWAGDGRITINVDYDAVGNRTHVRTRVNDPAAGADQVSDSYNQYDAMNRQTVADALDAGGGTLGGSGHRYSYDAGGNRLSDTYVGTKIVPGGELGWTVQGNQEVTERYAWDALGRLSLSSRDNEVVDWRQYDAAGRVLRSGSERAFADSGYALNYRAATGSSLQYRTNTYGANGELAYQSTSEYSSVNGMPHNVKSDVSYTDYDGEGNLRGYTAATTDFSAQSFGSSTTSLSYVRAEGYQQVKNSTQSASASGDLYQDYDVNGHLSHTGNTGGFNTRDHSFVNDANGTALFGFYGDSANPQQGQRQVVVNGEVLGRYGWVPDERYEGWTFPVPGYTPFTQKTDIRLGTQPLSSANTNTAPSTWSVARGDTLQGIARSVYGDESLWYRIADANGLGGNADLKLGQVLRIPQAVSNANNSGTFRPYDPSRIIGDTSPTMTAMPQGDGGGCGGVGQIIMVVVAIVVTIYTAGAAAGAWGAVGTAGTATASATIGGTLATGVTAVGGGYGALGAAAAVVGGAVGSLASQTVGVAIGAQDSINWKGVALGAVGAGVTAGLGAAGLMPSSGNAFVRGALGGAVRSTVTQGIAVATGLQKSFDWKGVAASALSGGVAQGLNDAMGYAPGQVAGLTAPAGAITDFDLGRSLVSGLGGSIVGNAARGGKLSASNIAADAFGNVIGDSLAAAHSSEGTYVSQEERLRDQFWEQSLGAVASRSPSMWQSTMSDADARWLIGDRAETYGNQPRMLVADNWARDPIQNRVVSDAPFTVNLPMVDPSGGPAAGDRLMWSGQAAASDRMSVSPTSLDSDIAAAQTYLNKLNGMGGASGAAGRVAGTGELSSSLQYASGAGDVGAFQTITGPGYQPTEPFFSADAIAAGMGDQPFANAQSSMAYASSAGGNAAESAARAVVSGMPQGSRANYPPPVSAWDALSMGWSQQSWTVLEHGSQSSQPAASAAYGLGLGTRSLVDSLTGAQSMRRAREAIQNGEAWKAPLHVMEAMGQAGMTALIPQEAMLAKAGGLAAATSAGRASVAISGRGVAINGSTRTVPLGFESETQFFQAAQELQGALRNSGIDDAVVGVRGSSVLGHSPRKGTTFGPQSDIDFFVESAKLTENYRTSKNIPGFVIPKKILPDYPALQDWSRTWSNTLGRDVTPGAFVPGTVPNEAAILFK